MRRSQHKRTCDGHHTLTPPGIAHHVTRSGPTPLVCWKLSAGSGMADVLCCSGQTCVWLRPARCRRGGVCRWACASSWGAVLSDSGDLSALPTPLFCPLLSSANGGCGGQGGRESHHLLRAASTPSIPPPCILCPSAPHMPKLGWPVFCVLWWGLCRVFLQSGCGGWREVGVGCAQAQAASSTGCVCQREGTHFLVCTNVPCGLVTPLAVRSGFCPIPAL